MAWAILASDLPAKGRLGPGKDEMHGGISVQRLLLGAQQSHAYGPENETQKYKREYLRTHSRGREL